MSSSLEPHIVSAPNEYRLPQTPSDGISCVKFSPAPGSRILAAASWDATVSVYDAGSPAEGCLKTRYHHGGPVLTCAFMSETRLASSGLDCSVKVHDVLSGSELVMGTHTKPVRVSDFCPEMGLLVTGSWDNTVKLWDPRTNSAASEHQQGERVYAMAIAGSRIIVGTAGRKILVWDIRQMSGPELRRESSLRYQTRCISSFPNCKGYVVSSIEGRVAVEYLNADEYQTNKYAFKCHRNKEPSGQEWIYPVNALAFHPAYNTFATGGGDQLVNIWDPFNKKRLCQFHKYPASISSLAFNEDGSLLAIASSYQYEQVEDPNPMPPNCIFVRKVTDQETKPKH